MPLNDAENAVEDIGLKKRNYFVDVEDVELEDTLKYRGPPFSLRRHHGRYRSGHFFWKSITWRFITMVLGFTRKSPLG